MAAQAALLMRAQAAKVMPMLKVREAGFAAVKSPGQTARATAQEFETAHGVRPENDPPAPLWPRDQRSTVVPGVQWRARLLSLD